MKIKDLLLIQLNEDIFEELQNYYKENKIQMNSKLYNKLCKKKIKSKLENITFLDENKDNYIYHNNNCEARIWDNHYGSRCKYLKSNNTNYCKHHLNMIKKHGKLRFNRFDEPKPLFNEKNNIIPWFNDLKINMIDNILQKHYNETLIKIKKDLRKNRQITPKF